MAVCVSKADADAALRTLRELGEEAYVMGELSDAAEGVSLC